MKNFTVVILIFIFGGVLFAQPAQQKPLTQAEYVKMLYELQKTPAKKDEIVEAIRTRGIGFELTSGLRGLTTSKSRNDAELKRTIEEAERRRQNPSTAKLLNEKESDEILAKARAANLAAIEEMPDFTVKQLISRGAAYAGTSNWKSLDKLTVAVNYSTTKGEQYKVIAVNGVPASYEAGGNYNGLDGTTSSGEFVEDLQKIFKAESKTEFNFIDTDVLRNRKTVVFEYKIALENNAGGGVTLKDANNSTVPAGEKGKIWIDRNTSRVLRVEYRLTDIPASFPVSNVIKSIDYDFVTIAGESYLLPILSDFRGTVRSSSVLFENRNLIRFKNYQKYGSEVKLLDEEIEESAPAANPKKP